ncbi:uncharacterized protein EI90DRAFT_2384190 [Cantharellus anzutake]|uniref:uncharacterized protein n=1 Tax=Cantharellus anzutake TaxID=1750568 RepID=UPI0019070126|nr:uncharacterized protein EI90DRAFT_2384190 [Cantharellus anzutake]KAF8323500.1 hypothetical protein EI90DRAFT_2384190 [Cantharellus anzutake]
MFKSSPNPYDEIVAKATDENQTSENWEIIISLCDKVVDEGEGGARNVIAAILKRLAHRTSNVQLYSLALAEALSKNCGIELHRELCSRSFTQGLEKLVTDRNTHDKVRKRALGLIKTWALEFESDPTLGIMYECYENLKSKHYRFDQATEAPPPDDDDIRRREEEELQRVLEMSRTDTGGLGNSSKAPSVSNVPSTAPGPGPSRQTSLSQRPSLNYRKTSGPSPTPVYPTGGYVPSARPVVSTVSSVPEASPTHPSPVRQDTAETSPTQPKTQIARPVAVPSLATSTTVKPAELAPAPKATLSSRVRALHTFEPTEPGELGFEKGDVIKVIERLYKEWWKGQLRGQTGIFPVNYVEPIPEPTPEEITREAQQEATIFAQAAEIDQLLDMLRKVDPAKDNLADNEEIQELYRSCMALRPKIVKLIDRYSQKRADLMNMNESFVRAKKIFDDVMEESLAKYNPGAPIYDFNRMPDQPGIGRPTSAYGVRPPTAYGWNPAVYSSPQSLLNLQAQVQGTLLGVMMLRLRIIRPNSGLLSPSDPKLRLPMFRRTSLFQACRMAPMPKSQCRPNLWAFLVVIPSLNSFKAVLRHTNKYNHYPTSPNSSRSHQRRQRLSKICPSTRSSLYGKVAA